MTASRCLHHAQRIGQLPTSQWAAEVKALPTRCEHDDCTHGDCQKVCQDWLRMQFQMRKFLARERQIAKSQPRKDRK
jgi:hypothetical protein